MTLGLKLLNSLWQKQANGITSLEFIQLIDVAREKALAQGNIFTLLINIDKREMELALYNPEKERVMPDYELLQSKNDSVSNEKSKVKQNDVLFKSNLPPDIEEFYSVSGIKLTSPIIYLHFYPDGTSDSIIVKYKNRARPYHFIPRNGGKGVFLFEINNNGDENQQP
jgi:hypothetical protein